MRLLLPFEGWTDDNGFGKANSEVRNKLPHFHTVISDDNFGSRLNLLVREEAGGVANCLLLHALNCKASLYNFHGDNQLS
eukprot:gene12197-3592_t